jgi:glycine dehydrogenase subunit 1
MHFCGGHGGFIATRDEVKFVEQFPSRLFGITETCVPGEYGFGDVAYERTSFAQREKGKEFVGTAAAMWGITAGVYLALMGPEGMKELGEGIPLRSQYAARQLGSIPGVKAPFHKAPFFKEFVVNFDATGKTVAEINQKLLGRQIFGGKDLSGNFPDLGQSALFCATEVHTKDDIDRLTSAVREAVK